MTVIDTYLKTISEADAAELERIRDIVHEVVPEATEVITYGMPGFKYKGKYLVAFNSFKDHLSIFPGAKPTAVLSDKLGEYKLSKGTIQFTLEKPLPDSLIKEMIDVRVAEIDSKLQSV
ncbi:MAG TPA: DUF1801 domain-containing protein [Candidatus Saccharimonadales bacterium]|nr:DUF1801 domain-containing protein [Candidatus Saccharimonadales bacterium]